MAKNERLAYFDNIKGILITLVVIGHLLERCRGYGSKAILGFQVLDFIYMFHMPLFIFITGLFCKSVFKEKRYRAEVPLFYFLLCFLLYTGLMAERYLLGGEPIVNYLTLNGRIPWYLMVVGFYVLAVPFFARLRPAIAIVGSIAAATLAGFVEGTNFLSASRAITFLPVFLAGFYVHPSEIIEKLKTTPPRTRHLLTAAAIVFFLAALLFFLSCGHRKLTFFLDLFYGKMSYEQILAASKLHLPIEACAFARIASYGAVLLAGIGICILTPLRHLPLLTQTGSHSLQVYIFHPFIYYALNGLGFTKQVFLTFPPFVAVLVLITLGTAISLILGAPNRPQQLFDWIKNRIGDWVDRGTQDFRTAGEQRH